MVGVRQDSQTRWIRKDKSSRWDGRRKVSSTDAVGRKREKDRSGDEETSQLHVGGGDLPSFLWG